MIGLDGFTSVTELSYLFFFFPSLLSHAVSLTAEFGSFVENSDAPGMEQVWSNVPSSSVGCCVQKDGIWFSCEITKPLGMLWSVWSSPCVLAYPEHVIGRS